MGYPNTGVLVDKFGFRPIFVIECAQVVCMAVLVFIMDYQAQQAFISVLAMWWVRCVSMEAFLS